MARWKALLASRKNGASSSPQGAQNLPLPPSPPRPRSFREIYTRIFFELRETVQKESRRRRQRLVRSICILWKRKNYSILRCLKCQERKQERRSFENPPFLRIYLFKGTHSTSIIRQIHLHQLLRAYRDKCTSSADIVQRISSFL